jgi:hypothetical protein
MSESSGSLPSIFSELRQNPAAFIAMASLLVVTVVLLKYQEGHVWWCRVGDLSPWSSDIWTAHNSQHLLDPYSFTHVLHGVLEFWLISLVFRRVPLAWRLFMSFTIACSWELAENSSLVIERYRADTISLNYFGDSVINSIADIFCCVGGFILAKKLRFWRSLTLFLATEAVLIVWIRDSLLINIVMLSWPIEAIKHWQASGH